MKFFLDVSRPIIQYKSLVPYVLLGIIHEIRISSPQEVTSVFSLGNLLAKRDGKIMIWKPEKFSLVEM